MNLYKANAWFVIIVPILLIIKGLITSFSSAGLDISAIAIAEFPAVILFFVGVVLLRAQDRTTSIKVASILGFTLGLLWLIILIPGISTLIVVILTAIIFLITVVTLFVISWYKWKRVGIVVAIVILIFFAALAGSYGASKGVTSSNIPTTSTE